MDAGLENLIKYVRREDVALFVGAGFSLKAGAPTVQNIIEAILKEASSELKASWETLPKEKKTLRKISELFVTECNGRNELISILNKILNFEHLDMSDHKVLYKIPHFKTIFTTNYDTLLESVFPEPELSVVTTNAGCTYTGKKPATLYKIHGDITTLNDPDSITITESDYARFYENNNRELLFEALKRNFVEKHMLFIGYSLEDEDVFELIEIVRDKVGANMKGMFLVAPHLTDVKRKALYDNKITYIDADAEKVLNTILSELKDKSVTDYCNKELSQETFENFVYRNGNLIITTEHNRNKNKIKNVEAEDGHPDERTMKFSIPAMSVKDFENLQYNDTIKVKGTDIGIPAYVFEASNLKDFSYKENGITILNSDSISEVAFSPGWEEKHVTFELCSLNLVEKLKAYIYIINDTKNIVTQTPIFTLLLTIHKNGENPKNWKTSYKVEVLERYKNILEAIKWTRALLSMAQGARFEFDTVVVPGNKKADQHIIESLKKRLSFYEETNEIEQKIGAPFDVYEEYSDDSVERMSYVYSYILNKPFDVNEPGEVSLPIEIDTRKLNGKSIGDRETGFIIIQRGIIGDMKLNGRMFNIPYGTLIYKGCSANDFFQLSEYRYKIKSLRYCSYTLLCENNNANES